jgi:DNA-binding transcriptional ArsR family regulator
MAVQPADLSTIFAALADPTRRAILARLSAGDAPVKDLAEPFELSGPAITKHLKVLERAGLISRSREGQQRPCRLEARALAPAADWIGQYREMWEERLDRLDSYLKSIVPVRTRRVAETKNNKTAGRRPAKTPRGERHGRQK